MMKTLTILFNLFMYSSITLFADTNTNGKVFYNYLISLDEERNNAFNMKRAYLTFANDVSETISYTVTYDMGSNEGGSSHTAFLKVAMVKLKTNFGDMSIGMQGMNMFKTMENTWGHRFIQKMPMDTYTFSPSADLGIGLTRGFGAIYSLFNSQGFHFEESTVSVNTSNKDAENHKMGVESALNGINVDNFSKTKRKSLKKIIHSSKKVLSEEFEIEENVPEAAQSET